MILRDQGRLGERLDYRRKENERYEQKLTDLFIREIKITKPIANTRLKLKPFKENVPALFCTGTIFS